MLFRWMQITVIVIHAKMVQRVSLLERVISATAQKNLRARTVKQRRTDVHILFVKVNKYIFVFNCSR